MSEYNPHYRPEVLQDYLERAMDEPRRTELEAHVADCAKCAAELEVWRDLLSAVDSLRVLEPSQNFRERVLSEIGLGTPADAASKRKRRSVSAHPTHDIMQDLLDGRLPVAARVEVGDHLATCASCRTEVAGWRSLHDALERLPRLQVPIGFAARVMTAFARSRQVVARPTLASRLWGMVGSLLPRGRRGRALASGFLLAPSVGVLVLVAGVSLHPLLTFGDLFAFVQIRMTDWIPMAISSALQTATGNPWMLQIYSGIEAIRSAPQIALSGLIVMWAIVFSAAWIVYRNVVAPTFATRRHAHVTP